MAAAAADYSLPVPGEILMEILVKLPCIESLVRCTSVCKSWYSLIKDPYFIAHHLSYQNNINYSRSKYLFCAFACTHIRELDATGEPFPYSIHYDNKAFNEYYKLEFPGGSRLKSACRTVHGYCNGLICYSKVNIASGTRSLYLWNPTIKKLKILPKFIIQNPKAADGNDHLGFGFGFDPKFKDYKVLKIGYTSESSVVELYSLNTNSWTLISDCGPGSCHGYSDDNVNPGSCYGYSHNNLVFANGTFYWEAHRGRVKILVSLDMKSNRIRETIMSHSFCLGTLGGRRDLLVVFGLSSHYKWHEGYCTDIRLYDEYFNKVLKIDGFKEIDMDSEDEYLIPIGFRNNGQVLLRKNFRNYAASCSTMVSYNLETRKAKDFGDKFSRRPYYVEPFVESLVLLNDEH